MKRSRTEAPADCPVSVKRIKDTRIIVSVSLAMSAAWAREERPYERGKEGDSAFSRASRMDATMAAHQHNYSSLRLPGRTVDEGQALYSNASQGGASEHEPKAEGVAVSRGQPEKVEGCRLTVGTNHGTGDTFHRGGKDNREDEENVASSELLPFRERGNYLLLSDPAIPVTSFSFRNELGRREY